MGKVLLETRGLSNHFGKICTADNLGLTIEEGVLTSIIGPNGAGKSTLINLLTGYLPVQSGTVFFQGREITRLPIYKRVRQGICRSFQIVNVFTGLTVAQNVLIPVLSLAGRSWQPFAKASSEWDAHREAEGILARVGLSAERDTLASALSHGDQRLLENCVAVHERRDADAVAVKPRCHADEPVSGGEVLLVVDGVGHELPAAEPRKPSAVA
ncbi:MAG: ATP-binding cassette domain-containing protein, partial [Thermodesulfobacteriota bacterium]|nr:ATP-binding cassette domain-containing protein [Thermodesulfobacteriota bacterium]